MTGFDPVRLPRQYLPLAARRGGVPRRGGAARARRGGGFRRHRRLASRASRPIGARSPRRGAERRRHLRPARAAGAGRRFRPLRPYRRARRRQSGRSRGACGPPAAAPALSLLLDHVPGREGRGGRRSLLWRRRPFRRHLARRHRGGAGAGAIPWPQEHIVMSLVLHAHPLSSYCWKALIALYEKERRLRISHGRSRRSRCARRLRRLWPLAKMPVLEDRGRRGRRPGDQHHHRLSGRASSAARSGWSRRSRRRSRRAALGPDLRSLRPGADAEDRRRPAAARGPAGPLRAWRRRAPGWRRRWTWSIARWRASIWARGEALHPRRLRGAAGALLRRQGDAVRAVLAERFGLARAAEGAAERRAGAGRGRALFPIFPDGVTAFSQRVAALTGVGGGPARAARRREFQRGPAGSARRRAGAGREGRPLARDRGGDAARAGRGRRAGAGGRGRT